MCLLHSWDSGWAQSCTVEVQLYKCTAQYCTVEGYCHHNSGYPTGCGRWNGCDREVVCLSCFIIINIIIMSIIIIITRPKPAYGRQGLAGSWGQDTDEVSTFLVFLTSHFAPAALSSDLTNLGPLMTMKIHLETFKNHGNQSKPWKTIWNHEKPTWILEKP